LNHSSRRDSWFVATVIDLLSVGFEIFNPKVFFGIPLETFSTVDPIREMSSFIVGDLSFFSSIKDSH